MKMKLKILIDEFSTAVDSKKYSKVNYDTWRQFVKLQEREVDISFVKSMGQVYMSATGVHPWVLPLDDKSLGEFIFKEKLTKPIEENKSVKENNNMVNLFKGFDFGSCANDNVKVSMYGIAVKNASNTWVSYDSKTGNIIDVDILNFDGKYLYKMPVPIKDVAAGDVVIHNRKPMFVSRVEGGKILAIDPAAGEEKVIILTKSMFGFDFATKVVNLFSGFMGAADANNPFGNMLPLMLMNDNKSEDMLPMFLAMGGKFDMSNPMMMYLLMKDKGGSNDVLPLLLMSNYQNSLGKCDCDREG